MTNKKHEQHYKFIIDTKVGLNDKENDLASYITGLGSTYKEDFESKYPKMLLEIEQNILVGSNNKYTSVLESADFVCDFYGGVYSKELPETQLKEQQKVNIEIFFKKFHGMKTVGSEKHQKKCLERVSSVFPLFGNLTISFKERPSPAVIRILKSRVREYFKLKDIPASNLIGFRLVQEFSMSVEEVI